MVAGDAPLAVPVMVMLKVLRDALRFALTVIVEVPVGVTGLGLKDTLTFFSCPEAESVTGDAVPLTRVTLIPSVALLPRLTVMEVLVAEREITGAGAGTVTVTVVVPVREPEVPCTVMV